MTHQTSTNYDLTGEVTCSPAVNGNLAPRPSVIQFVDKNYKVDNRPKCPVCNHKFSRLGSLRVNCLFDFKLDFIIIIITSGTITIFTLLLNFLLILVFVYSLFLTLISFFVRTNSFSFTVFHFNHKGVLWLTTLMKTSLNKITIFSGSHANSLRWETLSMSVLPQGLRSIRKPCCACADSHRRQTIQVQVLW